MENISSLQIRNLFNDNNNRLLDYIFDHIKIYNDDFFKFLLFHYRDKVEISISDLNQYISDDKFKILTYDTDHESDCGKYLLIECNRGKEINFTRIEFLVEHGANINERDNKDETPLINACRSGNEGIIKYLVEHGADINKENKWTETPLFISFEEGNDDIVKYLVENGADVNKEDGYGKIPLFISCEKGNESIVKYLVEHGADVNKENGYCETSLLISLKRGKVAITKYLN